MNKKKYSTKKEEFNLKKPKDVLLLISCIMLGGILGFMLKQWFASTYSYLISIASVLVIVIIYLVLNKGD